MLRLRPDSVTPALRRAAAALVFVAIALVLALPSAGSDARRASDSPVEDIVAACPSASDIAAIDARLSITFESDPTAGTDVCGTTQLRANVYRTLLVMQRVNLARPLPWTGLQLWDWFTHAISGIRMRGDITSSSCCDPANTLNIQTATLLAAHDTRWIDPGRGGLSGLMLLLTHEARHNEGLLHTCASGSNDATWDEFGGWGVQYGLSLWLGLYGDSFLDAPAPLPASQYRDSYLGNAQASMTRFCSLGDSDLAASSSVVPQTVAPGRAITVTTTVTNPGAAAGHVYLSDPVPPGTSLLSATPSSGSCLAVTPVRVSCDLGALAAGASASVALRLRVTSAPGTITTGHAGFYPLGPYVVGTVHDPSLANNEATWGAKVVLPLCKPHHRSTAKHPCAKT
jgi:uncharacterized repeat protein (TIGR01451 family)